MKNVIESLQKRVSELENKPSSSADLEEELQKRPKIKPTKAKEARNKISAAADQLPLAAMTTN